MIRLAGVIAAEQTASRSRAAALALVGAAYSLGTGAISVLRGVAGETLGFGGVFALALVSLLLLTAAVGLVIGPVFTYLFENGERILGASAGQMAILVLVAGPPGWLAWWPSSLPPRRSPPVARWTPRSSPPRSVRLPNGTFRAAALTVSLPAILLAGAYFWLPETRGLELERSAPEPDR